MSTADNSISYSTFCNRKKVDPVTGKPSATVGAIKYNTFKVREAKKRNKNNTLPSQHAKRQRLVLNIVNTDYKTITNEQSKIKQETHEVSIPF